MFDFFDRNKARREAFKEGVHMARATIVSALVDGLNRDGRAQTALGMFTLERGVRPRNNKGQFLPAPTIIRFHPRSSTFVRLEDVLRKPRT